MALGSKRWLDPIPVWILVVAVVVVAHFNPFDSILGDILGASATVGLLAVVAYCARMVQRSRQT